MSKELDVKSLIVWGGAGLAAYLIWKTVADGSTFSDAVSEALSKFVKGVGKAGLDTASGVVGIPSTSQVANDPKIIRYLMDYPGMTPYTLSLWATPVGIAAAAARPPGSGLPPPVGSAMLAEFPPVVGMVTNPPDPTNVYDGMIYDAMGNPIGYANP